MLHLLTESQKNKVIKEYRLRLAVIICTFIIFICLTGLALLLPSYLSAIGRVNSIKDINQQKKESIAVLKKNGFEDKIKKVDNGLKALKISIKILTPREAYDKIVGSLPLGVSVDRYTYNLLDDSKASISISGLAGDRDKLMEFQSRLKSNPEFKGIDVPLASFTKKTDLSFSLNFNVVENTNK